MGEFIEFTIIDKGYYNPETGKDIPDITGRKNRHGIDAFTHRGHDYPDILKQKRDKIKMLKQKNGKLLLELDISSGEASNIKERKAKHKSKAAVTTEWGIIFPSGVTQ